MGEFFSKLVAAGNPLWYYWPLAIAVGIVYKTAQYDEPRQIVRAVFHFLLSVTAFMVLLAVILYLISECIPASWHWY